jgi:hypothetical protein
VEAFERLGMGVLDPSDAIAGHLNTNLVYFNQIGGNHHSTSDLDGD